MLKKTNLLALIFLLCILKIPALAAGQVGDYLCELGIKYFQAGKYDDALHEFEKALIVEPDNLTAKKYIDSIFKHEVSSFSSGITPAQKVTAGPSVEKTAPQQKPRPSREEIISGALTAESAKKSVPAATEVKEKPKPAREDIISDTFSNLSKKKFNEELQPRAPGITALGLRVTGEAQASLGMTPDDAIWKRANADLNERNWRMLSRAAFDNRTNTFDPRVYDRLRVNLDTLLKKTDDDAGFDFHSNITVDPWSFTGRSAKKTITGTGGDTAEYQLKYWSNSGYAINETVRSLQNGDSFSLPELKVKDNTTSAVKITSTNTNIFTVPATKIYREFQPLRELWADYRQENYKLRVFPIAYQDQALNSDDPLQLANHHIWWQESQWLSKWTTGNFNSGATPVVDFTRGKWDNALSFFTRDSDGTRLTALRGMSFEISPLDEDLSLATTFASPKGLWQDYNNVDNIINATRLKYRPTDNLSLGGTYTFRTGLNENNRIDVYNNVGGVDIGFSPWQGQKASLEVATSNTRRDLSSNAYKSEIRGNAYYFSWMGTSADTDLLDLKYGYEEINPGKASIGFFGKFRFYFAQMDKGFDPTLSTYRETRRDSFWARHIHFRQPAEYFYNGLYFPSLKWDDIKPAAIGDGIDIGRQAVGFRLETLSPNRAVDNLFDVRRVNTTEGKYAETVVRDETTYKVTDKLTTKILGLYQDMPKTKGGIDPFLYDTNTGIYYNNAAIEDGKDPSLTTGSLGLEYAFTDWLALNGIWERTNDSTLAYGNFPRGVLNSSSFTTFADDGRVYRRVDPFLYSQGLFPLPPYSYFNIFKTGLRLNPRKDLEIYLDYTRNEFKSAGQVDDNINHVGLEVSYLPSQKLGFYFRYTYSRWNDINRMLAGLDKIYLSHHNFFTEFRYLPSKDDEFVMQYGESGRSPVSLITTDPFGGSLLTLDTRHIIRMYYRRRF